tara:strand:- start:323 stop:526 length:204 start_codon:yes stop_codon:yes gene_type:complete
MAIKLVKLKLFVINKLREEDLDLELNKKLSRNITSSQSKHVRYNLGVLGILGFDYMKTWLNIYDYKI